MEDYVKMKNLLGVLVAIALVLCASAQAAAYFTEGDLICVVYSTAGNRVEVATDLGPVSSLPTSGSDNVNLSVNLYSFGGSVSYGQLNIAYFAMSPDESTFWVSGANMPVANSASGSYVQAQAALSGGLHYYGSSSQQSQPYSISNTDSYYYMLDGNGSQVGLMGGLLVSGSSIEAQLSSSGAASLTLYQLTISTNGSKVTPSSTGLTINTQLQIGLPAPIPVSVLLFGSGLLALLGIKRAAIAGAARARARAAV